jgi:hypothetical protein
MNDKQIRVAVHQKLLRHYSATPNTLILVLCDVVEVPVGAEENLTVGNGWRRVARLAQVIHGQKFELLRIGPKNGGDASSARGASATRGTQIRGETNHKTFEEEIQRQWNRLPLLSRLLGCRTGRTVSRFVRFEPPKIMNTERPQRRVENSSPDAREFFLECGKLDVELKMIHWILQQAHACNLCRSVHAV